MEKRFVAFFDVLGFSDQIQRTSAKNVMKEYSKFIQDLSKSEGSELNAFISSDSIIVYTEDLSVESFKSIVDYSGRLFVRAFRNHFPLRGAIDGGEFEISDDRLVYVGRALIRAYKAASSQKLSGVILTPNCEMVLESSEYAGILEGMDRSLKLIQRSIQIKTSGVSGSSDREGIRYCVNWVHVLHSGRGSRKEQMTKKEFYSKFVPKRKADFIFELDVEEKIENTYGFYDYTYKILSQTRFLPRGKREIWRRTIKKSK